jgi:hypothetical protein
MDLESTRVLLRIFPANPESDLKYLLKIECE